MTTKERIKLLKVDMAMLNLVLVGMEEDPGWEENQDDAADMLDQVANDLSTIREDILT